MESRTYSVRIYNDETIEFAVKFGYFTYQDVPEIEAHNKKYSVSYRLSKDQSSTNYEDRDRARYALLNNGVTLQFNSNYDKLRIMFKYGTDCGKDACLVRDLGITSENKLPIAVRDDEIATLKRKYEELLNKVQK